MKTNALSWKAIVAYVVCGIGLFYTTSNVAGMFANMDGSFPIPIRVVVFVGPFGWLAFALLSALVTLRCNSIRWTFALVTVFALVSIGVSCTLLFTNFERPTIIAAP
jgi:hypothetical protein